MIIGVPVYLLGPHGSYKMLCDRFVGAEHMSKYSEGKPCVIVMQYGTKAISFAKLSAPYTPQSLYFDQANAHFSIAKS